MVVSNIRIIINQEVNMEVLEGIISKSEEVVLIIVEDMRIHCLHQQSLRKDPKIRGRPSSRQQSFSQAHQHQLETLHTRTVDQLELVSLMRMELLQT